MQRIFYSPGLRKDLSEFSSSGHTDSSLEALNYLASAKKVKTTKNEKEGQEAIGISHMLCQLLIKFW